MVAISADKGLLILLVAIIIIIVPIFFMRMSGFEKGMDDSTRAYSCLEEDSRVITSDDDCNFKFNGTVLLAKFDNVPSGKFCCQLKT